MKIAAAQLRTIPQDTRANIANHLKFIDQAVKNGVSLLLFPEMSLTGYERERGQQLALTAADERLHALKKKAVAHNMLIVAGAPVSHAEQLYIGAFIFFPNGTVSIYTKQFLHDGEEKFFVPGNELDPLIKWNGERISLAVCADITHPVHAYNAGARNTSLYLAGIFYTPSGIESAYTDLGNYAKAHNMKVLMANYVGQSYGFNGAGQSAGWDNKGSISGCLDDVMEGLLIVDTATSESVVLPII